MKPAKHRRFLRDKPVKKAVIYARVSTKDQDCERQIRDLTAFAKRCDFEIIGVFTEKASGTKNDRAERKKVMELAQARKIDAILVTELTRWGRNTLDLIDSLQKLEGYKVSVIAQTGVTFDLSTSMGKMMSTFMAALAEFERDTIKERVVSGLAAAKARGKKLGRPTGSRVTENHGKEVMKLVNGGYNYRRIADKLGISKNTVTRIVKESA